MRAKRIDANHTAIVQALRKCGASVQSLATVGAGCPDLLVGFRGRNTLLEVKDGTKPPSERRLTGDQQKWVAGWRGQIAVVESVEQALGVVA